MNELEIINNIRRIIKAPQALNLNDDVFYDKKKSLLASIDSYIEKIHFLNFKKPDLIIKKVIRSSISDILSKGVDPVHVLISFSGSKKKFNKKNINLILKSINQEQKKYNFFLIGGDTTSSPTTQFTICTIGYSKKIIKRNYCSPGEDIYLTGNIGDSSVGLEILKNKIKISNEVKKYFVSKYFKPKLPYGFHRELLKFASSSMDVSDGLLIDLKKLLGNKNKGFIVDYNLLPKSAYLKKLNFENKINIKKHLFSGDDYQILFTVKKKHRQIVFKYSKKWNQKVTRIGTIIDRKVNYLKINNNLKKIVDYQGYIHNF